MTNNIYTYEVNHGDESPCVGHGTIVNGGEVVAVSFSGQLSDNQKAWDILDEIFENHEVDDEVHGMLLAIQALI